MPPLDNFSSTDRALFYQYGLGPSRAVSTPVVHHAFQQHAATRPDAIAVEHRCALYDESITYGELDQVSDQLAHILRALPAPIVPGTRVCVLARRSVAFVAAILATLKAGAQYVPLDAQTITDETLGFIIGDANPSVVLSMAEYLHRVPSGRVPVLSIETEMERGAAARPGGGKVEDLSGPADGAYCIYTSGTTGRPKGVDVRHRGIANVLSGSPGNVGMAPGLRVAQLLNIAFDMGAWEILGALYNGATLCLRGNTSREWKTLMRTVNVVIATPSILSVHDPADYPLLQSVIVKKGINTWFSTGRQMGTSHFVLQLLWSYRNLHMQYRNPSAHSRDPMSTKPAPIGGVGCMWVGGVGVSGGYLNMEEKTRERWRPDPFVGGPSSDDAESGDQWAKKQNGEWARPMMFNTGDLGRWRKDGQLEHMGRADDQVKVKGFRVELDGVAMAMRTHAPVHNAVALLINNALWGFVTPANVSLSAVRAGTARSQPSYAVPTLDHFMALEEFPMTRNGKVDKRELHAIVERASKGEPEASETRSTKHEIMELPTEPPKPTVVPCQMIPHPIDSQFVLEEPLKMVSVDLA
ncbi:Linear gramicidin synthase subunit C [Termitomyces sp. J132]|nr:Linear gramicidin synthase subunit C [Termitomyces sp. J132]